MGNVVSQYLDTCRRYLFASEEEMRAAKLSSRTESLILRVRELYTFWTRHYQLSDKDIARYAQERFGINPIASQREMHIVKFFLGEVNQAGRKYNEWLFRQRFDEAWKLARKSSDPAKSMASLLSVFVKANNLDKPESETPDYASIAPQPFEITADPQDAGYKRIPNLHEKVQKLLSRYQNEIDNAAAAEDYAAASVAQDASETAETFSKNWH